jgi:hypothetical protein
MSEKNEDAKVYVRSDVLEEMVAGKMSIKFARKMVATSTPINSISKLLLKILLFTIFCRTVVLNLFLYWNTYKFYHI